MLRALELLGFKSFADKTRFEFPPGITVVVGPNGSGKSNIVDAVKWVLGAQSAKGLRGKEMADVIFKGSGTGGRRAMNTAEATIIFDNRGGRLPVDAPEVHVTRRVYRSGEGEYMINGQPCRLRDIKDMVSGTGMGAGAYSLIEQGKVDTLLQASPLDRRAIFEEAAGISRFKAKKVDAQRRLERVDQNLLRLCDIVDEVESRLRSVRAQASKARRYKEYRDRLQQLRTHVGMVDWRELTDKLEAIQAELTQVRDEATAVAAQAHAEEAGVLDLEAETETANEDIRQFEARIADNRESVASRESSIDHERRRFYDLEEEASRHRGQLAALNSRAGDLNQELQKTVAAVERAEDEHRQNGRRLADRQRTLTDLTGRLDGLRSQNEARREEHVSQMRTAAMLGNQISARQSLLSTATTTADRCRARLEQLQQLYRQREEELDRLCRDEQQRSERVATREAELKSAQAEIEGLRRQLADRQEELAQVHGRRTGVTERAAVIEELERRREGLTSGVKEVLRWAGENPDGPFSEVVGLVADLLRVGVESASLVEVALGQKAQHVVVKGQRLWNRLQSQPCPLGGRVGFVPLPMAADPTDVDRIELDGKPGVVGRADRFVQCDPKYSALMKKLLGRTWFVESLSHAIALRQSTGGGRRFVTVAGELLESDGTLFVGPRQASTGIISRRSELRVLRQQIADMDQEIVQLGGEIAGRRRHLGRREELLGRLAHEHRKATAALADHRVQTQTARERYKELGQQQSTLQAELQAADGQRRAASEELQRLRARLAEIETGLAALEAKIRADSEQIDQLDAERQQLARQATDAKVELAKSQQQLEGLRTTKLQYEEHRRERSRAIRDSQAHLVKCFERCAQAERSILHATSEVAELYLRKDAYAANTVRLIRRREALTAKRAEAVDRLQRLRRQIHKLEEKEHKRDLAAGEVRHQRDSLADRLREDYGIELGQLEQEPTDEELQQREQIDEEIAQLRRKISNIGAVNLEALSELEELDVRYKSLSNQYKDLVAAKESLERIINKINADSRRLFSETLEAVRANFQGLFRKVFGGGSADIVLDEETDILESGIEIVATPPGKHSLGISLLSGGERALTAVTLLLAIFQFRPSPFCVLDEVDGPLDEANIGRFLDTLKDFLGWTKFVIVTHSKKTMTAATTLYGVTMQESGVSKRVSVQFDDVSEDGHISREALRRETDTPAAGEDDERGAA